MANPQIILSRANGIRFVKVDEIQAAQFESRHMDDYLLKDRIYSWMTRANWNQKWTVHDAVSLQFEANFSSIQLQVIDCSGNVYLTQNATQVRRNTKLEGFFIYQTTISWDSFDPGVYFVKLTLGGTTQMISHPQQVFASLPDSLLFQWYNSKFLHDIIYETGIVACARFDMSALLTEAPGNQRTSYIDQQYNATVLKGVPFRTYNLIIEGKEGAPDWVGDMLNYIFSCDNVFIDGKPYALIDGNIEGNLLDVQFPLRAYSMKVQEGINRSSNIVGVDVDPSKRLLVAQIIDATIYGDTTAQAGSNLIILENMTE